MPVHCPIRMRATAAPEEGNKVRLSVELSEEEIDHALEEVLRRLSREVRVPGFRPGKVPRRVIEARMGGSGALRGEALREVLPEFYARAVSDTEVDPIDQPDIDITSGDETGPVSFDAVVLVRPTVSIAGYSGLAVTVPSLEVTDDEIDEQIDRMRRTSGELVEVGRPALDGDQVTIDIHGARSDGGDGNDLDADDFLYEVGSGAVAPELDEQLRGARPGDILSFESSREGTGLSVVFRVLVKTVKELVLPEVTDEWTSEESEFSSVAGLRAELTEQLRRRHLLSTQMVLQQRAAGALVELVTEEIPEQLVGEEVRERLHDLGHRLEAQNMSVSQFLSATGRSEQEFLDELRAGALDSVKLDLALRALADAEGIEPTEAEIDVELANMGEQLELSAEQVREQLDQAGRLAAVRSEQRKAKAMRWLIDSVDVVDEDGNPVSREDLGLDGNHDAAEERVEEDERTDDRNGSEGSDPDQVDNEEGSQ